jgi:hypothetical protein
VMNACFASGLVLEATELSVGAAVVKHPRWDSSESA